MASASTAKKPTTKTVSKARRAPARAPAIKAVPDEPAESVENDKMLKRNDLLAAVAARSSLPKSDLRAVVELVLDEMGRALDSGHDLALPPLGRIKVQKRKSTRGAEVMTVRLRRKGAEDADPSAGA